MYKNKKILVVVLARGGSKGIKHKNLKKINKISLVGHVGNLVSKIKFLDKTIISTDSNKIGNEGKKYNLLFDFKRPKKLSGDKVSDQDALLHALKKSEKIYKQNFDIVVSLPPTSPLRKKNDVIKAIKKMINFNYDSLWTISPTDKKFHPMKALKINKNYLKFDHIKGSNIKYRQQLYDTYYRNGVAYIISKKLLLKKKLLNQKTGYYLINSFQISIDTLKDLKLANNILSANHI